MQKEGGFGSDMGVTGGALGLRPVGGQRPRGRPTLRLRLPHPVHIPAPQLPHRHDAGHTLVGRTGAALLPEGDGRRAHVEERGELRLCDVEALARLAG